MEDCECYENAGHRSDRLSRQPPRPRTGWTRGERAGAGAPIQRSPCARRPRCGALCRGFEGSRVARARTARRAGVEKFVYTSTVATIAVPREGGLPNEKTQSSVNEMIGHYKRSKFEAERSALRAPEAGLPVVIVNPTTPVGPGDWKPTPTGRIIVDFLNGRMPGYVDTGLNFVPVEDCARGHLLAAERGRVGERYILGGRNLTLKEVLDMLAAISGLHAPRWKFPHAVAYAAGCMDTVVSRFLGREPQIPLDGV